ncbi:MAG: hypothetical protein HND52_10465 [Ignavibacteriae bacterium]|nr:hypothetical protein [Ignavibacteriota bacterium]NOG98371.1 hypothetical protein [Ignavibacteriota bacterium]
MIYKWYDEISNSDEITQGDLIFDCNIPILNSGVYETIISEEHTVEEPIDVKRVNVIVLSQACDIKNEKIDSIVLCPVFPLKQLSSINSYYKSKDGRESLRQGKEPAFHLLNNYENSNLNFPYSVVEFHRIYALPKEYLKSSLVRIDQRLRLLPPYREHLAQAFARYFMRVGLPLDIDRDAIKSL